MTKDLKMILDDKYYCINGAFHDWKDGKGCCDTCKHLPVEKRHYTFTDIEKFLKESIKEILPKEMINTKEESDSDWFLGYGFNICLKQIKDRINYKP